MRVLVPCLLVLVSLGFFRAQESERTEADVVADAVRAAEAFLATLDEGRRAATVFAFDDEAQRRRWSNLPVSMVPRTGARWGDLDEEERAALEGLWRACLSPAGVRQIVDNMASDEFLAETTDRGRELGYGADEFYFGLLGTPSTDEPWGWQFGGHHLAINVTVVGERMTIAPSLTGGRPMDFEVDGREVRQLAEERDLAFALVAVLDGEQREEALRGARAVDLVWGPGVEDAKHERQGVRASTLRAEQRKLLLELVGARLGVLNEVHAAEHLARVEADLEDTWFAWWGPTEPGAAASFRIQGPALLMEYCPQASGGTSHVHAMLRDPTNDYGRRWLAERR